MKQIDLRILLVLVLCVGLIVYAAYRAGRSPCVSREPGLRGEVMRQTDGKYVYFNGECWTSRPMPPTDTPF